MLVSQLSNYQHLTQIKGSELATLDFYKPLCVRKLNDKAKIYWKVFAIFVLV